MRSTFCCFFNRSWGFRTYPCPRGQVGTRWCLRLFQANGTIFYFIDSALRSLLNSNITHHSVPAVKVSTGVVCLQKFLNKRGIWWLTMVPLISHGSCHLNYNFSQYFCLEKSISTSNLWPVMKGSEKRVKISPTVFDLSLSSLPKLSHGSKISWALKNCFNGVVSSGNVLEISSLAKESWIVTSPIKSVAFSNGRCRNTDIGMCGNVSPQDAFPMYLALVKGKISACSSTWDNSRLILFISQNCGQGAFGAISIC